MNTFKNFDNNSYPMSMSMPNSNITSDTYSNMPPCKQPIVTKDKNYLQGYLNSIIGSYVKIEFNIGTNLFIDQEGILKKVGIDYVVVEVPQSGNNMVCDMYSIKFVSIIHPPQTVSYKPDNKKKSYGR